MKASGKKVLSFDSLEIGYASGKQKSRILPPISGESLEGEMIAVVGRNGIGKSTLLRTLAGLQPVLSGNLRILGRDISEYSRIKLSSTIGYISTEIVKVSNMKVYDLVALGRFPHTGWLGRIGSADNEAIMSALERTGISAFSDKPVTEISDGERQRAMIAMVLAQDASVMVMDEPTAFLDIGNRFGIINLMHELTHLRNKSIIFSTHDLNIALNQADKIWLLLEDALIGGAPEDIMLSGAFRSLFDSTKIEFNPRDGTFTQRGKETGTAIVEGEGEKKYWTERAVMRAGLRITDTDPDVRIIAPGAPDGQWKCHLGDSVGEFSSVYELVGWIRSRLTS
ncbi:MAG: ABC transporter ATP-binding protein [Bacteroidales bacterium]